MKQIIFLLSIVFICFSCAPEAGESNDSQPETLQEEIKDGVFIHLSHGPEDPHRVLMALRMAEMMSEDKDVMVYFDIEGVHVVLEDSENLSMEGDFPNSHEQLLKLMERNVTLQVCPGCLKAAGKTPEELMEGIELANKDDFFNFTDGRILSIDY
ncbi:MAG: DsrE family protein [Bacteroidota bacterium]